MTNHSQIKSCFRIDALGALLSAIILGLIMPAFQSFFGIPFKVLYILAGLPLLLVLYDLVALKAKEKNQLTMLKGIALLNVLYSLISILLAVWHFNAIRFWGRAYLLGEIIVVLLLAAYEWFLAQRTHSGLTAGKNGN